MPRSAAIAELLAVLAPPACAACGAPVTRAEILVCADCLRALPWLRGRRCPRCALPRHRPTGCPAARAAFTAAWAPMAYDGPARSLVQALKFRGALPAATLMAAQIAATLPDAVRGAAAAVVPVPPQRTRRRARGFDPAGLLAAGLAPRLGLPVAAVLERRDRAPRQTRASRTARRSPGHIDIVARAQPPPALLLVDDVHTTGATLDACARALRAAGATEIAAVTYARTL